MKKKTILLVMIAILLISLAAFAYWFFVLQSATSDTSQTQTTESEAAKPASDKDVASLIASNGTLGTFNDLLKAAGLASTLEGAGPYTVLAPSNAAFSSLPSGTLDRLQKPENVAMLTSILNYHLVSGSLLSDQLTDGQKVKTLNGQEVVVSLKDKNIYFIDAKGDKALVTKSDIKAKNGVIYIINTVLLPQ